MTGCRRFEVETPLEITRRAQAVDEQHRRAATAIGVVDAERAHVEHAALQRLRRAAKNRADHAGSMRAGARNPATSWPEAKRLVFPFLITVTAPGPIACHLELCQTTALRSSMPSRVAPGSACSAESTQRWPKVSKCGSTAVSATSPSASVGRRLKRFGQLARMSVGHCAFRALPRGRGGHDVGRAGAGGIGEDAVLLFVARVELVSADKSEHSRHVRHLPSIWACPKHQQSACESRRARPGSRTWALPRQPSTTSFSRGSETERSRCASTTQTSSATVPSTNC